MIEIQIEELKCLLRISDHTITVKDYQQPLDSKKELKKHNTNGLHLAGRKFLPPRLPIARRAGDAKSNDMQGVQTGTS